MDTHAPEWPGHLVMHVVDPPYELLDRAQELRVLAERFNGLRLAPEATEQLTAMVRLMNTYYSNKIEGNPTKVIDIENMQANVASDEEKDYSARAEVEARALTLIHDLFYFSKKLKEEAPDNHEEGKRELKEKAELHGSHLTGWGKEIFDAFVEGTLFLMDFSKGIPGFSFPISKIFLKQFHREFFKDFPEDLLWLKIDGSGKKFKIIPGEFRNNAHPIRVGNHYPPTGEQVPAFMEHFEAAYTLEKMPKSKALLALAASHHRFAYIHPFWDGNGRVARLMSHAFAEEIGVGAGGLWSLSRGLARGLNSGGEGGEQYKAKLSWADQKPMGATDGRGVTSNEALIDFSNWFFDVCIDQMNFMLGLFDFDTLRDRLELYVARQGLRKDSLKVLREIHSRGSIARGEVQDILRVSPRTASMVIKELEGDGIIGSASAKGPISLRFPVKTHDVLFPGLH